MQIDYTQITAGMTVVSPAGETIGRVKEVRTHDFVLDMTMRRDMYVPFSAIQELGGSTVVLSVARDEIGNQGWELTPLFGSAEHPDNSDSTAPREELVVGIGDPAERGTWSASSDSYDLEPLDTREGQLATTGTDDGELPRSSELPPASGNTGGTAAPPVSEADRLRDMYG
jgi:hypothetical protein